MTEELNQKTREELEDEYVELHGITYNCSPLIPFLIVLLITTAILSLPPMISVWLSGDITVGMLVDVVMIGVFAVCALCSIDSRSDRIDKIAIELHRRIKEESDLILINRAADEMKRSMREKELKQ